MKQESSKNKTAYRSLKKLAAIHYDAMALRLTGSTIEEIAAGTGRSPRTIDNWFYRDDLFREEFRAYKSKHIQRAKDILEGAAPKAAERMLQLTREKGKNAFVALGAAKDILDRAGLKPPDKHELAGKDGGPVEVSWVELMKSAEATGASNSQAGTE